MSRSHYLVRVALILGALSGLVAGGTALAASKTAKAAPPQAAPSEQFVDGIVAVVNKQVITLRQLAVKTQQVRQQMALQNVPVPDDAILRRQVLQQMINDELQRQEAQRIGLSISDAQVDHAVQTVAERNRLTVEQLRQEVQRGGLDWGVYREELRQQIRDDMLRQRLVAERISISDSDINTFLSTDGAIGQMAVMPQAAPAQTQEQPEPQPAPTGPELFELAQILIEVPERAPNQVFEEKRREAEDILRKLRSGADFAGLAASSSDGPQALDGGNMGIRPLADWPDLFAQAVRSLGPGQVSGILQSGRGFHILKVVRRGYAQAPSAVRRPPARQPTATPPPQATRAQPASGPMMVTQTHARHILIKTTKVTSDDKARNLLEQLRARIANGESFAELAKRYSEDGTAPQGGDLGWLSPGDTVPTFEAAMDALGEGQVSQPIQSPFGWHLILVEERRTKDMEDEFRRMQARRALLERRIGPAYEEWLDQLRAQAYIDNRLQDDPSPAR